LFVDIEKRLGDEDGEKLFLYGGLEQLVQTLKDERHWHGILRTYEEIRSLGRTHI
jgi:hypothetical protein